VIGEVDDEAVGDRRAERAPGGAAWPGHDWMDQQPRAPGGRIGQRHRAMVGVEPVRLADPDPGQLLPPRRQVVAAPRQRLLGR
jgi:hypothetical protein